MLVCTRFHNVDLQISIFYLTMPIFFFFFEKNEHVYCSQFLNKSVKPNIKFVMFLVPVLINLFAFQLFLYFSHFVKTLLHQLFESKEGDQKWFVFKKHIPLQFYRPGVKRLVNNKNINIWCLLLIFMTKFYDFQNRN